MATAPASADVCRSKILPANVAPVCGELTSVRADTTYGRRLATRPGGLAATTDEVARRLHLQGLNQATAVLSLADLGGVAAATGMPALPMTKPGRAGLPDVSSLPAAPDVPGLPAMPARLAVPGAPDMPVGAPELPGRLAMDELPDASGVIGGKAPISLPQPVGGVKNRVDQTLQAPKVLDGVKSAVPVPQDKPGGVVGKLLGSLHLGSLG
ncbi:hypothetical protein [Nonomuraea sediminis]|uniref:hypothetical protein n=1 Tax=Nonomuraea sediminis TaxID=2835864 RepID=UPI001BDC2163|nr:hypothetical protein [Nonomuraea sediminis]